jgi:hypothetical protein
LISDFKFRLILVGIAIVHFYIAFIFESFVIDSDFLNDSDLKNKENNKIKINTKDEKLKCYSNRTSYQPPYKKIEFQIQKEPLWPPITNHNNSYYVLISD